MGATARSRRSSGSSPITARSSRASPCPTRPIPSLREDLTQQIFLAVWQALPCCRADASLKTFIARVAQNRSISFVTKQVRQPPVAELPEKLEADDAQSRGAARSRSNEREMLLEATRRLPLPQREVIILVLEGFDYPEIAEMLDIAPNALALRLSRAKAALKSMLEQSAMTDFDLDRLGDVWRQQPDPAEMERLQRSAAAVSRRARWAQLVDIARGDRGRGGRHLARLLQSAARAPF